MIRLADRSLLRWAIVGDIVVLALITIIGFATHHTLDAYWRMTVTVLVTLIAWAVVAPWFDAFSMTTLTRPSSVWKILLATVVAGCVPSRMVPRHRGLFDLHPDRDRLQRTRHDDLASRLGGILRQQDQRCET